MVNYNQYCLIILLGASMNISQMRAAPSAQEDALNYYGILGVTETTPLNVIQERVQQALTRYNPTQCPDQNVAAQQLSQLVRDAQVTLLNDKAREAYRQANFTVRHLKQYYKNPITFTYGAETERYNLLREYKNEPSLTPELKTLLERLQMYLLLGPISMSDATSYKAEIKKAQDFLETYKKTIALSIALEIKTQIEPGDTVLQNLLLHPDSAGKKLAIALQAKKTNIPQVVVIATLGPKFFELLFFSYLDETIRDTVYGIYQDVIEKLKTHNNIAAKHYKEQVNQKVAQFRSFGDWGPRYPLSKKYRNGI